MWFLLFKQRIQQKSNNRRAGVAPEHLSELQTKSKCKDQGEFEFGDVESSSGPNSSSPPHLKSKHLRCRDKHGGQQTVRELPTDLGSPGWKEPLGCGGVIKARRMSVSSTPSSTPVPHVYAAGSPLPLPSIRAGDAQGSAGRFGPLPAARTHPSLGSMWDIYSSGEEHPRHPCRLPAAPQGHKLEFYAFCAPPPQLPHRMETVNPERRQGLTFWTFQPPPPRFLAPSYPGP